MSAFATVTDVWQAIAMVHERRDKLILTEFRKTYLYYIFNKFSSTVSLNGTELQVPYMQGPPALGAKWMSIGDNLPDPGPRPRGVMGFINNRIMAVPYGFDLMYWETIRSSPQKWFDEMQIMDHQVAWATEREFCSMLWNGAGGREPDGLLAQIEAAAPASQTASPCGLSKATYQWMRNPYVSLTRNASSIPVGYTWPAAFLALRELINQTTFGSYRPTHLVCSKITFDVLRLLFDQIIGTSSLLSDKKDIDFGFDTFKFEGLTVGWDVYCPEDRVLCFHMESPTLTDRVNNASDDKAKLDAELEHTAGWESLYDCKSNIALVRHPNFNPYKIGDRTTARGTTSVSWRVFSMNLGIYQPSRVGIAGSDNGSRWATYF